jgi:hypothetical protein
MTLISADTLIVFCSRYVTHTVTMRSCDLISADQGDVHSDRRHAMFSSRSSSQLPSGAASTDDMPRPLQHELPRNSLECGKGLGSAEP